MEDTLFILQEVNVALGPQVKRNEFFFLAVLGLRCSTWTQLAWDTWALSSPTRD